MLVLIALSINLFGDWLRDALNPRLALTVYTVSAFEEPIMPFFPFAAPSRDRRGRRVPRRVCEHPTITIRSLPVPLLIRVPIDTYPVSIGPGSTART
jgi:hypothetical protein